MDKLQGNDPSLPPPVPQNMHESPNWHRLEVMNLFTVIKELTDLGYGVEHNEDYCRGMIAWLRNEEDE